MHFTKMQGLGNDYLYVYGDVPENIAAISQKGNSHFVIIVPDTEKAPVEKIGPLIEKHPSFPVRRRTNRSIRAVLPGAVQKRGLDSKTDRIIKQEKRPD